LNTVIFFYTSSKQSETKSVLESYYDREIMVKAQGEVYAEFIAKNPDDYGDLFLKLSEKSLAGHKAQVDLLGRLAVRDLNFIKSASEFQFEGDQVLFKYWHKEFEKIQDILEHDPVIAYGLGNRNTTLSRWITYQFLHGGAFHLISNMWFLMIFGGILEPLLGSLLFLVLYLGSGFVAAGAFIQLSGLSGVPLVGASGAVSGLMGMYVSLYWSQKAKFMYWLLPMRGYTGFVELPAWILLVVWSMSDLAGYFGTVREIGGIAHAAHLGGAALGLILGYFLRWGSKTPTHRIFSHAPRF
jgi:membrane associated rhomboid family serine protease